MREGARGGEGMEHIEHVGARYSRSVGGKWVVTTTYLTSVLLYGPEGPIAFQVILSMFNLYTLD